MSDLFTLIAVDDERPSLQLIERFAGEMENVELLQTFGSAEAALEFLKDHPVDIVVLDIEMKGMNGLDFARLQHDSKIIFSTAHQHFALEGFNLAAVDYLLKPYTRNRFSEAVQKAVRLLKLEALKNQNDGQIRIKSQYTNKSIELREILFVESMNNTIIIHTMSNEPVSFRGTLKMLMQQLPGDRFQRVHRSYVVALDKVTSFNKQKVTIGARDFPVSAAYKSELLTKMNR